MRCENWEHREGWAPKNRYFWTVVLEKTPESPLDCKEIQPVNSKGDQSWIFIGRTDAKVKLQYFGSWCEELTHWKRPWCWKRLRARGEGGNRGWDGWMAPPTQQTGIWGISGRQWKWGKVQFMGSQGVRHNLATGKQQQKHESWEFPGGPVLRTQHFRC